MANTPITPTLPQPIGRFAPSPTGELHLGSLTTALASFCHIKSLGGKWLLRIEDTDTERCDRQFTEQILIDLEVLGLYWDDDVIYQSERLDIYNDYLSSSLYPLTYGCQCSRKSLERYWQQKAMGESMDAEQAQEKLLNRQRYPRCCLKANLDKEKNKLLQIYGYSLNDNLEGKFEFTYKDGKPFLKLLDTSIKRVAASTAPAKPWPTCSGWS